MVVTNHREITPDHPTGLWLSEFTEPYTVFRQARYEVTVASLQGGKAPIDPRSLPETNDPETLAAIAPLEKTLPLREVDTDPLTPSSCRAATGPCTTSLQPGAGPRAPRLSLSRGG